MRTANHHHFLGLLAAMALLLSISARADVERKVEKSFDVRPGGWLYIDSDLGSIEVSSKAADKVEITVFQTLDVTSEKEADELLKDLKLDFVKSGNEVRVTASYDRDRIFRWNRSRMKLRFVATVPHRYNVNLKTAGGSVAVEDLEGEAISRTSGGSLTFGKISGPVKGTTSGGSINLESCKGDADVSTSGGSISIGQVEGRVAANTSGGSIRIAEARGEVNAATSGGGITVEEVLGAIEASTSGGSISATITKQPQAACRLSTSGGNVSVALAAGLKANIDASTSGGRVQSDLEIAVQGELGKSSIQGKINGGGPELYLRTSGGNITITKALP
jgi:DUF4097 and DUF4098 domain-containing protein YvlB